MTCDVAAIDRIDLALIDRLARLALECRRAGRELQLSEASPALLDLLAFVGLADVLPCAPGPRAESQSRSGSPNIGK